MASKVAIELEEEDALVFRPFWGKPLSGDLILAAN